MFVSTRLSTPALATPPEVSAAPASSAAPGPVDTVSLGQSPEAFKEDSIFADDAAFRQLLRDSRQAPAKGTLDDCNQILDNCNASLQDCNQIMDNCQAVFTP